MIGARATFCAAHTLPQHPEIHGHSYEVWAFTDTWDDVEEWQRRLQNFCVSAFDHKMLSHKLSKMEDIAQAIGKHLEAKLVRLIRPVEGLCCEWAS